MVDIIKKGITNHKIILLSVLVLTALLRMYELDFQSPWLDEVHTLNEANPEYSLLEVYNHVLKAEQLPPLYFYIVYFLFKIFGYSIFVARAFSAILGVASVYVFYLLAKELINKKTALIAIILFAVNFYMIYYSQEARPYMMFVLFVILSYYRMILFLKNCSTKNVIWYGIAASLLIHTHIVGFFILFSQFITGVLYLFKNKDVDRPKMIKRGLVAALIAVLLYLPALGSFFKVLEIKSFWIRPPAEDALSLIYKQFFGQSEILIFFNFIFFIGFLNWLYERKRNPTKESLSKEWILVILFLWISLSVLIPVIRTYSSVPMIIGRYFIAVVPAILLLFAIGISKIKSNLFIILLLAVFTAFSLNDLFFVNDYYTKVKKSQFREATAYIMDHNDKNDKVVSSLKPYLNYFFKKEGKEYKLLHTNLNDFANKQSKAKELSSFWYFDAHNRKFNPSDKTKRFLSQNYIQHNSYEGFDAWAKHYIVKDAQNVKIDFSRIEFRQLTKKENTKMAIDIFNINENHLKAKGWALLESLDSKNTVTTTLLIKDTVGYIINSKKNKRPDVTKHFKSKYNADFSGFEVDELLDFIPKGNYKFGILLDNEEGNRKRLLISNRNVEVK